MYIITNQTVKYIHKVTHFQTLIYIGQRNQKISAHMAMAESGSGVNQTGRFDSSIFLNVIDILFKIQRKET